MVQLLVDMLVEIKDISPVFMDEFSDQGNKTGLVGAVDKEDCAVGQREQGGLVGRR